MAKKKLPGEFLTWEDLPEMKYTWKVASETLRMVPPVFGTLRTALKDIEYDGYIIPKGWKVFWVTTMTHKDGNIFPEPEQFDLSRFENQAATPPYCYIPSGRGPHVCPGMEYSRIETLVAMHYHVTRFTWRLLSDTAFGRDPTPMPYKGLPIQIAPMKFM